MMRQLKPFLILIGGIGLATSAIAQPANFKTLTLDDNTSSGMMMGSTGGTTSLPAVVSNSDRSERKCLGFGDPNPDHTIVLKKPVSNLTVRVDSGGGDTTLLISGPGGVRCVDSGSTKDAKLQDKDWQPGTYQVWVGTISPNTNRDYRLTVRASN
jgi:hypothetical protein